MSTAANSESPTLSHVYLTPDEVVELVPAVTKATLAQWRYARKGPRYYKVGRKVLYALDEIDAWIAESRS